MSRNIYDIFNERKSGIDCLVEGYEADIEAIEFENDDEIAYTMESMIQENANTLIEFQAASYLEDLVIENLMYNRFDEDSSLELIEESVKERMSGIAERLQNAWKAIKTWFQGVITNIGKMFRANEEWVDANQDKIYKGIKDSNLKVKANVYHDADAALKNVTTLMGKIRARANTTNVNKNILFNAVGIKDRSQIPEIVKKCFVKEEGKEMRINEMKANDVIDYAMNKKYFMDYLNSEKKHADEDYADILKQIESGKESDDAAKRYENFVAARGIVDTILSNSITVMKKACSDMLQICRKAVGLANKVNDGASAVKGFAKEKYNNAKDSVKQGYQNAYNKAAEKFTKESYEYDENDYLEEGMFSKYRKLSDEELDNKIEELQAALDDIEAGEGPKKFLKKAQNELKDARNEKARRGKKADKAANKAAKKEEKAAKKAAKNGGGEAIPAAECFMVELDEIEFEDDHGFYDED
jgi:hypothetical protein